MTRRCSHCSNNGHNSRTCPARGGGGCGGVKLFGVRLTDGSIIKKSASTSSLSSHLLASSSSSSPSPTPGSPPPAFDPHQHRDSDGCLSDDPARGDCASNRRGERKKGVPWTEEEHRLFLIGLQKLGKGDWRGIARNYVRSRTPTQVASHAQKYFIRQTTASRRRRRSSLFDMAPEMATDHLLIPKETTRHPPFARDIDQPDSVPSLDLSLASESKPMETSSHETVKEVAKTAMVSNMFQSTIPGHFPTYYEHVPLSIWPSNTTSVENKTAEICHHGVLKPIPLLPEEPINVDELVGMSQLSLLETENSSKDCPALSLELLGEPLRRSAFHANVLVASPDLSKSKNSPIQAV